MKLVRNEKQDYHNNVALAWLRNEYIALLITFNLISAQVIILATQFMLPRGKFRPCGIVVHTSHPDIIKRMVASVKTSFRILLNSQITSGNRNLC
jgi:hypothetical protein